jgi:GNAT superfamily N-acetyltransferase
LACVDGVPLGLVQFLLHRSTWTIADSCYLQDLYVDEGARGSGLGGLLIAHVADAAKTLGCERLYWLTHETNARARVLYDAVADRSGFIQYRKAL